MPFATPRDPLAIIKDLTELIEALDRRSPHLQRSGEQTIAAAATQLRAQASARIAELERMTSAATGRG